MTQVTITYIAGATYPINVYASDVYGNNKVFLATISSGPVPPSVSYTTLPAIFDTAPAIMLTIIDSNNCEFFEIISCGPPQTPSVTPTITVTPSVTPAITPTISVTPSITPTFTVTPTNTTTVSVTPSVTPTISVTPSITPTISVTPSITPTISVTPSVTPTISVTPTTTGPAVATPTNTPTPTVTPSITTTNTVTPTQTPTITVTNTTTPTTTPTPSITVTATNTPTPTPTSQFSYYAYIFAEPQDGTDDTTLYDYAVTGGAQDWYSYFSAGPTSNNGGNYSNDLNVYAHQPSFINGGGDFVKPDLLKAPIFQSSSTYLGCPQNQYTFGSIPVLSSQVNVNIQYFYTIWIPLAGVGGTFTQMYFDLGTSLCGSDIYNDLPSDSVLNQYDVVVTSGAAIPAGTYRVMWASTNLLRPTTPPLSVSYYFRGETKI